MREGKALALTRLQEEQHSSAAARPYSSPSPAARLAGKNPAPPSSPGCKEGKGDGEGGQEGQRTIPARLGCAREGAPRSPAPEKRVPHLCHHRRGALAAAGRAAVPACRHTRQGVEEEEERKSLVLLCISRDTCSPSPLQSLRMFLPGDTRGPDRAQQQRGFSPPLPLLPTPRACGSSRAVPSRPQSNHLSPAARTMPWELRSVLKMLYLPKASSS